MARRAWETYTQEVGKAVQPVFASTIRRVARLWTTVLWVLVAVAPLWRVFEGIEEVFGMHPTTIWRKVAKFRKVFGQHPDEFQLPGVTIDRQAFWEATGYNIESS